MYEMKIRSMKRRFIQQRAPKANPMLCIEEPHLIWAKEGQTLEQNIASLERQSITKQTGIMDAYY